MFRILDRNRKRVGLLENPIKPIIFDTLNTVGELHFDFPTSYGKLELEGYVQVENGYEYVIKELVTHGKITSCVCMLNIEEVLGMAYDTFVSKENNVQKTAELILVGTGWKVVNNAGDKTKTRNLFGRVTNSYNLLILMCTVFGVEVKYDTLTKTITIVDSLGSDKGAFFINDINLKKVTHDSHSHKFITRVIPVGKDGLTIEKVNGGKKWLENYTYSKKVIYGIWQSDRHDNATKLKEDAEKFLAEMAVPYETYEVVVDDLYKLTGVVTQKYDVGDTVTIIDDVTKTRIKQRVIQRETHLLDPSQDRLNIANKGMTFQEYYKRLTTIADMAESVLGSDGMVGGGSIDNDSITKDHIQADAIYAHHIQADQIQAEHILAESITADKILAKSITADQIEAKTITADEIKAGTITAGSGVIADGAIGTAEIGELDAGKIKSGTIDSSLVRISGANSNLTIHGNRMQVFQGIGTNQVERVSVGDVNGDDTVYGIRVRGSDGTTVLYDENGVYSEGITDGSINNDKISDNADIDGGKLNIHSVVTKINEGDTSIHGNRIDIDNESLTVAIDKIHNTQSEQGETISKHSSDIKTNVELIALKVSSTEYEKDKEGNTTKFENMQSQITQNAESIIERVEKHVFDDETGKIKSSVLEVTKTAEGLTSNVSDLNGKYSELKQTVDGFDFTGMVTFNDLASNGGTTINGGNITTGTLSGDRIKGGLLDGVTIKVDGGAMMSSYNLSGMYLSCAGFHVNSGSSEAVIDCGRLDFMKDEFQNDGILGWASGLAVSGSGNASVAKSMYANAFLTRYSTLVAKARMAVQPDIDSLNVVQVGDSYKVQVVDPTPIAKSESPFLKELDDFGVGLDLESVVASLLATVKQQQLEIKELKNRLDNGGI